ncbi:MAG: hypothetical protein HXX11_06910 [Desulfuromonadales bacterium]|nr:hypothetical protein [Desulfuromonadales bacterium]
MKTRISSRFKSAVLLAGVIALFPFADAHADNQGDSFTPSLMSPSGQEDVSTLNLRLQTAKKDLEVFRTFAEHFSNGGETKTVAQLQGPLDDYLKKHVDNLLAQAMESSSLDTIRLAAEIMCVKTRLDMILNRAESAKATVADMKKRFAPYQKITVQTPGKTTTLDEVIRQLEEELTKTTFTKK